MRILSTGREKLKCRAKKKLGSPKKRNAGMGKASKHLYTDVAQYAAS